jgi:hypothetical protein
MASIALARTDVIVGVDAHKDEHAAVALDGLGGHLQVLFVPATNDGYADLLAWADAQGNVVAFGVEGTGSYGIELARFLRRHGRKVIEVSRPRLARRNAVRPARATPPTLSTPPAKFCRAASPPSPRPATVTSRRFVPSPPTIDGTSPSTVQQTAETSGCWWEGLAVRLPETTVA